MQNKEIIVVGTGLSGSTAARMLAEAGYNITMYESNSHIGGMCYDRTCPTTGTMIHEYGPHTWHSQCEEVWNFVQRFSEFNSYVNLTNVFYNDEYYVWPINLRTISKFFKQNVYSGEQARALIDNDKQNRIIEDPRNFEEAVIADIGPSLYHAFIEDYTRRQWQCDPKDLPKELYGRIRMKMNFNDAVYNDEYQGMPINGYTNMIKNMLDHPNIKEIHLNTPFNTDGSSDQIVFFSGYVGSAPMRKLFFHHIIADKPEWPVINFAQHKRFTRQTCPALMYDQEGKNGNYAIVIEEPVGLDDIGLASYPIEAYRDQYDNDAKDLLQRYPNFVLIGRLALYRYYDMWMAIRSTMDITKEWIDQQKG